MKMKSYSLILLACLSLMACTRKSEESSLQDATVVFGPVNKDTQVQIKPIPESSIREKLIIRGEMNTGNYLRIVDDLRELSKKENNQAISELSQGLYSAFYSKRGNFSEVQFPRSVYVAAGIGEAEVEVKKQLSIIAKQLKDASKAFAKLLDNSVTEFPWPKRIDNLTEITNVMNSYVDFLLKKIPTLGISPELARPAAAAIKDQFQKYRQTIERAAQSVESAKSFNEALAALSVALRDFEVKLDPQQAELFKKANGVARSLNEMSSSQDALSLLIEVWRMVPAESRESAFKEKAPELYDFLNGKSNSELNCLEEPICLNPVLEIARRVFILPKISSYGVQKIHDQIDEAALEYLVKSARETAASSLPTVPALVKNLMVGQVQEYQRLVGKIQEDLPGFFESKIKVWSKENLPDSLRGLEAGRVKVDFGDLKTLSVRAADGALDAEAKTLQTGAETVGLSLTLAQEFLPSDPKRLRSALISPLLKLLSISGFRQYGGKTFPGLNFALDSDKDDLFNARNLMTGKTSHAVPDAFTARSNFTIDRDKVQRNASVAAQAELLRGLSRQIRFYRDWEKNDFDTSLGELQVEDIANEIPKGAVNFSVFPKDYIFAISLGSAGGILQNIIRDLSPAFLLLSQDELLWGNRYNEIGDGKVSTVAGIVDILNGQRGGKIRTADVARYILALDEFINATEGIEQTRSEPLTTPGEDGKTVLEQIVEARRYLKLFQMGLTNYLVYVAQEKEGGMAAMHELKNGRLEKVPGAKRLEDQVLAIRAIVASSNTLGIKLYNWAVLDTYFFLNRSMWNSEQQFYASELGIDKKLGKPAGLQEVAITLRAMQDLAPLLDSSSRAQSIRIAAPWIRALENL